MKALKEGNASESEKGTVVFCNHLSSDWVRLRSLWADHSRSERPSSHAGVGTRALTGTTIGGFSYGVRTFYAPMADLASPYNMVSYQEDLLIRCKCEEGLAAFAAGPSCMEDRLLKLLLRWIFISILTLGNAMVLAILVVVIYARLSVGAMMGRGSSPSEFAEPYISLIATSGVVGMLALVATGLYWFVGLLWIPALRRHAGRDKR